VELTSALRGAIFMQHFRSTSRSRSINYNCDEPFNLTYTVWFSPVSLSSTTTIGNYSLSHLRPGIITAN